MPRHPAWTSTAWLGRATPRPPAAEAGQALCAPPGAGRPGSALLLAALGLVLLGVVFCAGLGPLAALDLALLAEAEALDRLPPGEAPPRPPPR